MAFLKQIKPRFSVRGLMETRLCASMMIMDSVPVKKSYSTHHHVIQASKESLVEQAKGISYQKWLVSYEMDSDADDDNHVRGESDFWRRKMRTFHSVLDVDHNGVISFQDFSILADRFEELGHLTKEEVNEFRQIFREVWEKQWGCVSPYNLLTLEQYLADMKHVVNDPDLRKKCHIFLPLMFKAININRTGKICIEEFKLFFKCLGLSEENAAVTFAVIDEDGDGKVGLKEFVRMGRDFFLNENESCVSRMFWGPLADDHSHLNEH